MRARTAALERATLEQTQKIVCSRGCIPGGILSTMHGCVVLWLIDCALTVVSTMCEGNQMGVQWIDFGKHLKIG